PALRRGPRRALGLGRCRCRPCRRGARRRRAATRVRLERAHGRLGPAVAAGARVRRRVRGDRPALRPGRDLLLRVLPATPGVERGLSRRILALERAPDRAAEAPATTAAVAGLAA